LGRTRKRAFTGLAARTILVAVMAVVAAAGSWAFDITNTVFVDFTNEAGVAQPPITSSAVFSVESVISLVKSASRTTAMTGDVVEYALVVANVGSVKALGVVVVDSLPGLLAYVPASASPGPTTALKGPPELLAWSVGDLDIGQSAFISYAVAVGDPGGGATTAVNLAMAKFTAQGATSESLMPASCSLTVSPAGTPPSNAVSVVVSVYDPTGRLVRVVGSLMAAAAEGSIGLADGSDVARPGEGDPVRFRLSDGTVVSWDGLDSGGNPAPNGSYTVRAVSRLPDGREKAVWAGFTLFRPYKSLIVNAILVPNPATSVAWVGFSLASTTAEVRVRVYNVAGELIVEGLLPGTARAFRWDLRNRQGVRVADGLYVIAVEAADAATGRRDRRILKLAVGGGG
jgi:uncharacterized repeat protein (TIGR01451 family)